MNEKYKLARQLVIRRGVVLVTLGVTVLGSVGCGLPLQWQNLADKLPAATPEDPVHSIVCVWQPSQGHDPNGEPTRGFAGQIMFYTRRQETPVRVSGDVRVYVYDDQGPKEDRGKPIHQWDFHGDAWKIHLHDGTLGPTYSVFIPYSRKGSHQAQCALRVRLTPEHGHPIYSEASAVILPGLLGKKEEEAIKPMPKDSRTSLESITIPLKEKQAAQFKNMPSGETKIERVIAPTSELARRSAMRKLRETVDTAAKIETLPAPPPQTLPNPIIPSKPIPVEPVQTPPATPHPLTSGSQAFGNGASNSPF